MPAEMLRGELSQDFTAERVGRSPSDAMPIDLRVSSRKWRPCWTSARRRHADARGASARWSSHRIPFDTARRDAVLFWHPARFRTTMRSDPMTRAHLDLRRWTLFLVPVATIALAALA